MALKQKLLGLGLIAALSGCQKNDEGNRDNTWRETIMEPDCEGEALPISCLKERILFNSIYNLRKPIYYTQELRDRINDYMKQYPDMAAFPIIEMPKFIDYDLGKVGSITGFDLYPIRDGSRDVEDLFFGTIRDGLFRIVEENRNEVSQSCNNCNNYNLLRANKNVMIPINPL